MMIFLNLLYKIDCQLILEPADIHPIASNSLVPIANDFHNHLQLEAHLESQPRYRASTSFSHFL
jgi:hypothetical protein